MSFESEVEKIERVGVIYEIVIGEVGGGVEKISGLRVSIRRPRLSGGGTRAGRPE